MNILEQILEVKQQEMANMHTLPTAMGLVPKISFSIPPPSLPTMLTIPMDPSIPAAVDFEYPRSSTSGMACNIAAPVTISLMEKPKDNAQKALDFSASITVIPISGSEILLGSCGADGIAVSCVAASFTSPSGSNP